MSTPTPSPGPTAHEVAEVATFCALDAPPAMTGSVIDMNGASYMRT